MSYIQYREEDHIGYLTIDRPEALNALNSEVLRDLEAVIDGITTETAWCVIVTGAGEKAFVAGADIAQMRDLTRSQAREFGTFGNRVFRKLECLPVPTVAAVGGYCLGGGMELAMACDIRLASDKARFGQPETGLGITPGFGGTQRLARLVGPAKAKELLFTAEMIDAAAAAEIGLVNRVVPAEELAETARAMAAKIAANAPVAVRQTKQALREGLEKEMDEALRIEAECFASCFQTEDQHEAMSAFLEKRKASPFQNR